MAYGILLEFDDSVGKTQYDAVNEKLGLNWADGTGDWPDGLMSHAGGTLSDGGHLSCIEHNRRGWPTRLQRRCQTDVAHCHASKRSASPREE